MRLSSICSEAWRNLTCGTAKLALMVVLALSLGLLTGGYEVMTITGLQNQAKLRVLADADVVVLLGDDIDGVTCDRLTEADGGPTAAGAFGKGPRITPLATPGMDLDSYQVSAGLLSVLAVGSSRPVNPNGTWVSRSLANDFALGVGSVLPTDHGDVHIAGIFDWPNDGRDTRLAYALVTPIAASEGSFQECWAKQWPRSSDLDIFVRLANPVVDDHDKMVATTSLNKGFDMHYNGFVSYRTRLTRWMPYLALVFGMFLGVWSVIRRRLEYAGALHVGEDKGSQLLTIAVETLVWLILSTIAAIGFLTALSYLLAPLGAAQVLMTAVRSPLALSAGALLGALGAGVLIRESQLFHFFKSR